MADIQKTVAPAKDDSDKSKIQPRIDSLQSLEEESSVQHNVPPLRTPTLAMAKIHIELVRAYNRRLPINKLPIEVLCIIFQSAVKLDGPNDWMYKLICRTPLRECITSVCSHWRTVAVSFSALWTTIEVYKLQAQLATLYRQRAGLSPITLSGCDISCPGMMQDLVFSNIYNIKSVEMSHSFQGVHPRASPSIRLLTHLPGSQDLILERLKLEVGVDYYAPDPVLLTEPLFGGRTPLLRDLELEGLQMPWRTGFYCNLYALKVNVCSIGSNPTEDEDILHVLRDCPSLHTLSLCLKESGSASETTIDKSLPTAAPNPIRIPSLRDVELKLPVRHICHLLRNVDFSSAHNLEIEVNESSLVNATLALTLPPLLPHDLLRHFDRLSSHLSSSSTHHRGSVDGSRTRDTHGSHSRRELTITWAISRDDEVIPLTFNDTMIRRITQALAPHVRLGRLTEQEIHLNDGLFTTGSIPCALYPFVTGLLLPSRCLHVHDEIASYEFTDETVTMTPEAWPCLKILKLSGRRLDSSTTRDWIEWCKRLSAHSLRHWSLRFSTFSLEEGDGPVLAAEIAGLGLRIEWPII